MSLVIYPERRGRFAPDRNVYIKNETHQLMPLEEFSIVNPIIKNQVYSIPEEFKSIMVYSMDGKIVSKFHGDAFTMQNIASGIYIFNFENKSSGLCQRKKLIVVD
jgi:hypothetical protein